MARLPRYTITNQLQHIILPGREGTQIAFQPEDYQYFRDCLAAAAYNYGLKLHAWVVMPDHVHILATPERDNALARTIQSVGRNYVQYYNECYGGSGTLWQGRYRAIERRATVVDPRPWLLTCSRYIESNPVRNGLVGHPRDYAWSSYAANAGAADDDMLTPHREYLRLGPDDKTRARVYREGFRQKIPPETVALITESTLKGWALGDRKFASRIEKLTGRRAVQLPRGRPRKSS